MKIKLNGLTLDVQEGDRLNHEELGDEDRTETYEQRRKGKLILKATWTPESSRWKKVKSPTSRE